VIARQQFNSLGSHDVPRIRFIAGDDPGLNRMAAVLQFTYVGTPCVYYGDEVGLGESNSEEKRQPMSWDESTWDMQLRAFYQKLIVLRKESPALIDGGFQLLLADEHTLAYLRDSQHELLITVAFRGPGGRAASDLPVAHGAVPDGVEFVELFSGARARVENGHLPLPAMQPGAAIWQASY
jgi:alpha-glucosidase